jgi:cytochrome d ubiquinol oxidase subunit I
MTIAVSFGLASALSVVVLGDESGYTMTENQKMKIAAIEAMWETEPAPAGFTLVGIPSLKDQVTRYEIRIPWVLGIIATRSLHTQIPGIKDLVVHAKQRIQNGIEAYKALQILKKTPRGSSIYLKSLADFQQHQRDLGYGLLLKRYLSDITKADETHIAQAANSTIPNVPVLFWSFRIMVGLGFFFIAFFGYAFYLSARRQLEQHRWFLRVALWSLPLPWIAMELGWIVAEYGRQPWAIEGILPTFLGVSSSSLGQVTTSLVGFIIFYTTLLIVDIFLMLRYVKLGPEIVDKESF